MLVTSAILLLIILLYVLLITKFTKGWERTPYFNTDESEVEIPVTVIVSCKNEREQLPALFQAIQAQDYKSFEFIFVDDHSKDGSWEYALAKQQEFPQLSIMKNNGNGKKDGVKTAVYASNSELIVSIDADSTPLSKWLRSLVAFYTQHPSDLIIGPVRTSSDNRFFQNFQQMEFASLVGSGAGAAGAGMPILCNGANLAFRKSAWLASESELHFETPSGDDIFLLQSIKKRNGTIHFLKSSDAIMTTPPKADVKSFLNQRKRWASKHAAYADIHFAYTGIVVFLSSLAVLISLIFTLIDLRYFFVFLTLFGAKWLTDFRFQNKLQSFFNLQSTLANSLLFSLVYPFYIVFTAFGSLGGNKSKKW